MRFFRKFINSKWIQHLVFWVLSVYAIGTYFSISSIFKFIDFFYAVLFHIPLLYLVYVNLRILIPRFLEKGKYGLYALNVLLLLATTYGLHEFTFEILLPILPTEFYMVSFTEWQVLLSIFVIYLVLTTLIKLSKSWYTLQQLQKEKLSIELNSLKAQVNPHFLFNSLNSIYSQALSKSEQTADTVLELSNLLRYMLYEVGEDMVPLSKEIEMLENYIELQKLRVDESAHISWRVSGELEGVKIAPLLVFPLVENAFKHGLKGASEDSYVRVSVHVDQSILIEIENNIGEVDDMEKGKYGGIGLENVKRRLELIYPRQYELVIDDKDDSFHVKLELK
jgi:sensor histidine kinase YesM